MTDAVPDIEPSDFLIELAHELRDEGRWSEAEFLSRISNEYEFLVFERNEDRSDWISLRVVWQGRPGNMLAKFIPGEP